LALRFLGRTSFDRFHIEGFAWAFDRATGGRSWPLFKAWGSIQLLRCCGALGLLVAVLVLEGLGFTKKLWLRLTESAVFAVNRRFVIGLLFVERLAPVEWFGLAIRRRLVVALGLAIGLSIGAVTLLHRRFIQIATLPRVLTAAIFEFDVLEFAFGFEAL
jgi:hypothetical protein